MPFELYNDGNHKCIAFTDLVQGDGIQSNQFLIVHGGEGMLLDPGGNLVYKDLLAEMATYFQPAHTRYVFASHEDPDIIASANGWLLITDARIVIAQEWLRFIPHFCSRGLTDKRLIGIPPRGMRLDLGGMQLQLVPAHYLHAVGNFQVYDPLSRILFSGDLGASLTDGAEAGQPVQDFDAHLAHMLGFHQRFMTNNKACRLWAGMARQLDIDWIVPQHGASFRGSDMVARFIDWVEQLECGTDLLQDTDYALTPDPEE